MFKSLWRTLQAECSGKRAYQNLADISSYHRIQASPGFRAAAEYVREQLADAGIQSELLHYPADTSTAFWGAPSFQEWNVRSATLHLIEPRDHEQKLADYLEVPISLIQRSVTFDGELQVVVLEDGEKAADYEGLDVAGKLVLTRGNPQRVYDLAVVRRGAAGILFDGMRTSAPVRPTWALPDAIQYTSFWWYGDEPKCFGFALSPRAGEALRRLIRRRQDKGEGAVRVRASVDAELYDGTLDVLSATIPGQGEQEVVLVGHLCHPRPSCNDNASGAAAVLEVARSLQSLISSGQLPHPQRTLRFLWVPEMTGTYAFLAANESLIPDMVCGLNLDMVGQDQTECGSVFVLESPPDAMSSFAPDLLACLRERLFDGAATHSQGGSYPLFRHAITPFGGGSDHYIFADPSVGVPMPMIIQWPDKFYHTTADTLDKVDPEMLGRVCVLSAAYLYWLGQAGEPEARWLQSEMSARFRQRVIQMVQEARTDADEQDSPTQAQLRRQVKYKVQRHQEALASLSRLAALDVRESQAMDERFALGELDRAAAELPSGEAESPTAEETASWVPVRRFRGPLSLDRLVRRLAEAERDEWWRLNHRLDETGPGNVPALAQYWADGKRTVAEIAGLIALESGAAPNAALLDYFRFLERMELIRMRRVAGSS